MIPILGKKNMQMQKQKLNHAPSPDWPDVTNMMVEFIPVCENELKHSKQIEETLNFNYNLQNLMAIASKIFEFYSLGSLAFRPSVNWDFGNNATFGLNSINSDVPQTSAFPKFKVFFYISFSLAIIYIWVGIQAI